MTWNMQKQLGVGAAGEALFLKHWPDKAVRHPVFKGPDFLDSKGRILEVKTDTYPMQKTPNFFMERWSDRESGKPGGPWQAHLKGATCFVYMFIGDRTWFVCEDLPQLCTELDGLIGAGKLRPKQVMNRGWITEGYAVPRVALVRHFREEIVK